MKVTANLIAFLALGIQCGFSASAQDPVQQQQQQQFQAEQNRLGYYNQQGGEIALPPRPSGKWIKTWGAIAKDVDGTDAGVSVGKLSRNEAEKEAINECTAGGGRNCKPLFAYRNQCVAYSSGLKPDGRAWEAQSSAATIELASSQALQSCADNGGKECRILYTACTDPVFQSY